jgi:hypothetical protein
MKTSSFKASWDTSVKLLTMLVSAILGYYILPVFYSSGRLSGSDMIIHLVVPLFLLTLGLAFMVTGYSVDSGGVVIHRMLWHKRIPRSEIADVAATSILAGRGIGLCGIWGFCGYTGIAYSSAQGFYFVAASDRDHRIVLSRRHGLPVIISPSDSEAFIQACRNNFMDVA